MLKVGDRLLCKKNTNYNKYVFASNKYKNVHYIITKIFENHVYFDDASFEDWFLYNNKSNWYIWDYFYTPQEMRKLKLKQLNKC